MKRLSPPGKMQESNPKHVLLSSVTLAAVMISLATCFRQAAAQEGFMMGDPQYESMRNHYEHIPASCILSLPAVQAHYGAPSRAPVCITQQDVDLALDEAASSMPPPPPPPAQHSPHAPSQSSEQPTALQIISKADLLVQASRLLTQKFRLTEAEALFELPKIDAGNSQALAEICPDFLEAGSDCFEDDQALDKNSFRSLSGFCNNQREKSWGSSRSAMVRFLPPDYQDSIWAPRVAVDGSPLPSARVVSFVVHQDPPESDHRNSMLGVVWGQFINHDINLGVRITDEDERLKDLDCCKQTGGHAQVCNCFPIEIPKEDPFYGYFGVKCMNFVRLSPALQPGCSMGPAQAMNKHSSYLDGSSVYGSDAATLKRLRTFHGGQLKSAPVPTMVPTTITEPLPPKALAPAAGYDADAEPLANEPPPSYMTLGNAPHSPMGHNPVSEPLFKDLLPPNTVAPDVGCERHGRPKDLFCFDTGDTRANEQIQLASLHTIMMREHNRLARGLAEINPHWSDERLFQEARKIVGAQIQHITYAEFLPLVVGKEPGLELAPPGQFFHGYDDKINAGVRAEFQSAAFRYGHSLVPGHIDRFNKFHDRIESVRLSKLLKQPFDLYFPGVLDTYIMGLADQRSGRMDSALTTEVANHLFEKPGTFFGMDLAAINIQRAREMGVRGYNAYREFCGLPRAKNFAELTGTFSNKTLFRMSQIYKHVDDIDLFTGGISEYHTPGAITGPTFSCLIAKQASILKAGDRFWYENPGQFSLYQLDEIRRQTSARLLCDNSDDLEDIQANAMLIPDPLANPRVPCSSLPTIDLNKWREVAHAGSAEHSHYTPTRSDTSNAFGLSAIDNRLSASATNRGPPIHTMNHAEPNQDYMSPPADAYEDYQRHPQPDEGQDLHGTLKSFSHYVDHLVDTSNYQ